MQRAGLQKLTGKHLTNIDDNHCSEYDALSSYLISSIRHTFAEVLVVCTLVLLMIKLATVATEYIAAASASVLGNNVCR